MWLYEKLTEKHQPTPFNLTEHISVFQLIVWFLWPIFWFTRGLFLINIDSAFTVKAYTCWALPIKSSWRDFLRFQSLFSFQFWKCSLKCSLLTHSSYLCSPSLAWLDSPIMSCLPSCSVFASLLYYVPLFKPFVSFFFMYLSSFAAPTFLELWFPSQFLQILDFGSLSLS